MSFTSVGFLPFLVLVLLLYRAVPRSKRWIVLLASSYFFYACHSPWLLCLIVLVTLVCYLCAIRMETAATPGRKRAALAVVLVVCLGVLFIFKYLDFTVGSIFFLLFGDTTRFSGFHLLLPMGISFYVFQSIAYALDVYRGRVSAQRHLGYYALFVVFFPQLVAGPIERYCCLMPQLEQAPDPSTDDCLEGLKFLVRGYAKKVLIADFLAQFVDEAYGSSATVGGAALLIATVLFALQIYCDFSGYSDIALGCARMMGIRLTENFRRPYSALSLRDFWRRWHISLTRWFTDYVYIPLGGSRKGLARQCLNIVIVFLLSGLWHGANVTFLIWGGLHGIFLAAETLLFSRKEISGFRILRWAATFSLVCFAWIFFRSADLSQAVQVIHSIFTDFRLGEALTNLSMRGPELMTALLLAAALPMLEGLPALSENHRTGLLYFLLVTAIVICRCLVLTQGGDTAFLYFQF